MKETEEGRTRDAGIIAAGQKIENYEIATYSTLRAFAEIMGHEEAIWLLHESLDEEKEADEKLTEITPVEVMVSEETEEQEA